VEPSRAPPVLRNGRSSSKLICMKRRSLGKAGSDFSSLLAEARRGDSGALAELHRRYFPAVLARLGRRRASILRRHFDTVDLSQSVFVDVLRDLPRFEDRGEDAFRSWLLLKAENKVRMKLRHRMDRDGRLREDLLTMGADRLQSYAPGPVTSAGDSEERGWLHEALLALPPPDRRIVLLRTREGLPYAEIARRVGLESADAARMRFARALLALRRNWPARA